MYGCILAIALASPAQSCFFDQAKTDSLKNKLPKFQSEALKRVLDSKSVRFYDLDTMPMAYQDFEGALRGIHSPRYNISANRSEPHGNGNVEFPWGKPAGTHRTSGVNSVKFINLPTLPDNSIIPIIFWHTIGEGYEWLFPHGTVIGEILFKDSTCFEIRTRTRNEGKWNIDVLRPFLNAEELRKQIAKCFPSFSEDAELKALFEACDSIDQDLMVLEDSQPDLKIFNNKIKRIVLPGITKEKANILSSDRIFRSALGTTWTKAVDSPSIPTLNEGHGIIPANYDGDFVEISSKSCARCHDTVNTHVRNFNFRRDWYGKIRGSDGIFSFSIFDPSCISDNGIGQGVRINQELLNDDWIISRPQKWLKSYYSDLSKR